MNYHTFCGIKQQKCLPSQFWRPEVQNQGVSRPCSLQWPGEGSFLASPASGGSRGPGPVAAHPQSLLLPTRVCPPPSLVKAAVSIGFRPHPGNPGWTHLKTLISLHLQRPFSHKIMFSSTIPRLGRGLRRGCTFLGYGQDCVPSGTFWGSCLHSRVCREPNARCLQPLGRCFPWGPYARMSPEVSAVPWPLVSLSSLLLPFLRLCPRAGRHLSSQLG